MFALDVNYQLVDALPCVYRACIGERRAVKGNQKKLLIILFNYCALGGIQWYDSPKLLSSVVHKEMSYSKFKMFCNNSRSKADLKGFAFTMCSSAGLLASP